jgi:ribosome-binding protein aMBF1 (putative translation factor)
MVNSRKVALATNATVPTQYSVKGLDGRNGREDVACAFGLALRKARQEMGLSQERLSEKVGLDSTYPSLLERGLRAPSLGGVAVQRGAEPGTRATRRGDGSAVA